MIKKLQTEAYIITALTNMHPGSGDSTFGVVDNLIQREPTTDLPTIHSSSLKGAFRECFENRELDKELINFVFGSDNSAKKNEAKSGAYSFLNADILCLPVRSNKKPFYRATCPHIIGGFMERWLLFSGAAAAENPKYKAMDEFYKLQIENGKPLVFDDPNETILEDSVASFSNQLKKETLSVLETIFGKNIALFSDADFELIAGKERIPVIARNHLENGQSKNVWYEEYLPRETRFVTFIFKPTAISTLETQKLREYNSDFETNLTNHLPVQIGANASIGYGLCKITKI